MLYIKLLSLNSSKERLALNNLNVFMFSSYSIVLAFFTCPKHGPFCIDMIRYSCIIQKYD